jgi:hypothetical protein
MELVDSKSNFPVPGTQYFPTFPAPKTAPLTSDPTSGQTLFVFVP